MQKLRFFILASLLLLVGGCNSDRLGDLEKQNAALKAEAQKRDIAVDYDLQAKCSKDADLWFRRSFQSDKDTMLLTFNNHYNKTLNKCFIASENHLKEGEGWTNIMSLWDVYENLQYGEFQEDHHPAPRTPESSVVDCMVAGHSCNSSNEWYSFVHSYLSN